MDARRSPSGGRSVPKDREVREGHAHPTDGKVREPGVQPPKKGVTADAQRPATAERKARTPGRRPGGLQHGCWSVPEDRMSKRDASAQEG